MTMFSHIVLGSDALCAAKAFNNTVLGALGHGPGNEMGDRVTYAAEPGILMITKPFDGHTATSAVSQQSHSGSSKAGR